VAVSVTSSSLDVIIVTEGTNHLIIGDKVNFAIGAVNVKIEVDNLYWVLAIALDAVDACFAWCQLVRIGNCRILSDCTVD